jgi:hypothetical protein
VKRLSANSVTQCLMDVMEEAEQIEQVLVLYRYKDSNTTDREHLGSASNDELTVRDGNWLVDCYKNWVTRSIES